MNFNKAHIIGIGGVSMSAIAEYLLENNINVTGSDRQESALTKKLEKLGAIITYGHFSENITDQGIVIKTAAVKNDSPEILRAKELGIPVLERAEFLGEIQKKYKNVVCVAGTHGKTSTTSMLSAIALQADVEPTIMVGSHLDMIDGTYKSGKNDYFIIESCEYCNSFLSFSPTVAVINNIEADHLDFFNDLEDVMCSFEKFSDNVPENGCVIFNGDDENCIKVAKNTMKNKISFGLNEKNDVQAINIQNKNEYYSFDVKFNDIFIEGFILSVPGLHNLYNALASIATSLFLEFNLSDIKKALEDYSGPQRRFQKIGEYNGALVVDDYAHHPTEIEITLKTANNMGFNRVICVFQSHTYTRTIALFDEFIEALSLCEHLIVSEIYSAREINKTGISGKDLSDKIKNSIFIEEFQEIESYLRKNAKAGDLIITMGAGELNKIAYNLVSKKEPQ